MGQLTILQAVTAGIRDEMQRDDRVVLFGEDVGLNGGVFRATDGLQKEFGESRVFDTPLCENGILGVACGMALYGLRPIAEIQFLDFIYTGFDMIVSEIAKMRYRSGGQFSVPMVIRTPYGGGIRGGLYHSQSTEAYFIHTPGLKVVIPSTPYDTKGLLISAIRDEDPVIFMEPKRLYRSAKGDVPEGDYTVPIGKARVVCEGGDVTVLTYGAMVPVAEAAATEALEKSISAEVIDLRTLLPLDLETVLESVSKTGRVVIVHEAAKTGGFGAELSALIAERAIEVLEGPIVRVTGYDTPFPYTLEHDYLPDPARVLAGIEKVFRF
ncbi:MAG TPA: alpha-ketoacid dehydrogenase subunit beta [Bdellovibrionota bacterium]|nr:alpha-ketoacid dehydrogenase subunit beta [Bdellovibrionota bacterium]